MYTIFTAFIPSYIRADGVRVPATDAAIFGVILPENRAGVAPLRELTQGEARSALLTHWRGLADVEGIEIRRSTHKGQAMECDVVPHYSIPGA